MSLTDRYRYDIMKQLLKAIGVKKIDNYIKDKTPIYPQVFDNKDIKEQFKNMVPDIKKLYSSDKLTALHSNAFEKQKNPCLNLVRQILRENHFDIKSKNISEKNEDGNRIYKRVYYIVRGAHIHKRKKPVKITVNLKLKRTQLVPVTDEKGKVCLKPIAPNSPQLSMSESSESGSDSASIQA